MHQVIMLNLAQKKEDITPSAGVSAMLDTVHLLKKKKTPQESVSRRCTTDCLRTPALLGDTPAE